MSNNVRENRALRSVTAWVRSRDWLESDELGEGWTVAFEAEEKVEEVRVVWAACAYPSSSYRVPSEWSCL